MQQISKLLEPDPTLPGIKKLCRAVLIGAIEDISKRRGVKNASLWIFSNDTKYIFSFLSVCEILRLDPFKVRNAVDTDCLSFF